MISDPQDLRRDLLGAEARGEAAESGRGRWGGLRASATGACVRKGAGTHTHTRGDTVRTRRSCRGPRTKACDAPPRPQEGPALLPPALAPAVRPSFSPPRPSEWCLVTAPRGRDRPPAGNQPRSPCITLPARPQTHAAAAPACPAEGSRPGPGGGLCISMASARVHQVASVSRVRRGPSV